MGADVIGVDVADARANGGDVASAGPAGAGRMRLGVEGRLGIGALRGVARWVVARVRGLRSGARDAGMATAEYAIATLAAVGFAGLLVVILRSDEVRGLLLGIVRRALSS